MDLLPESIDIYFGSYIWQEKNSGRTGSVVKVTVKFTREEKHSQWTESQLSLE
jgi:uncharacterized protein YxeA